MKNIITIGLLFFIILVVFSCDMFTLDDKLGKGVLRLCVSFGPYNSYPGGIDSGNWDTVLEDKMVFFTATGVTPGVNDDIELYSADMLHQIGEDTSKTLFASHDFALLSVGDDQYPGGSFEFMIFVDMDGDGMFSDNDIIMDSYTIWAYESNKWDAERYPVESSAYGSFISYNSSNFSIIIDDPISFNSGYPDRIQSIQENEMLYYVSK